MVPRSAAAWYADVPRSSRLPTLFGFSAVFVTLLGFGVWGSSAPIAGAVVASGVFVTTGQNKIVQHLEGGVIKEIKVKEGDIVAQGQVLVELDETGPRSELRRLVLRQARLSAMEARLQAEMNDADDIRVPPVLAASLQDRDVAELIEQQRLTFLARRRNVASEITTLQAGIDALNERVKGGTAQLNAVHRQLELFEEELKSKSHLLDGGMIRKSEVLALQRARANLQGEIGRLIGELGDARERIVRTNEQIAGVRNNSVKQAVEQLHEVHGELKDVRERIRSAQNLLDRITITAPVEGVVVKLRYHTPGGVIEAGKNVLEIVPQKEELIVEVRVQPRDIDVVKSGQAASVRLTALNARTTPMIAANVVYVSADALPDEKKSMAATSDVYVARIRLDAGEVAHIKDFVPTAGMPAEVYIKTAERTFFEYLMRPISDSMSRAFREM